MKNSYPLLSPTFGETQTSRKWLQEQDQQHAVILNLTNLIAIYYFALRVVFQRVMVGSAEQQLEDLFHQILAEQLPHCLSDIPVSRGELLLPSVESINPQLAIIYKSVAYPEQKSFCKMEATGRMLINTYRKLDSSHKLVRPQIVMKRTDWMHNYNQ